MFIPTRGTRIRWRITLGAYSLKARTGVGVLRARVRYGLACLALFAFKAFDNLASIFIRHFGLPNRR